MRFELAWDGGVSDGDPGPGRIRVNSGAMRHATHFLINSRDRHGALIGEPVAKFWPGDVLHLERDGGGLIVAWVMGEVSHSGTYYKVPISVRSSEGAFAGNDIVTLHHQADLRATGRPEANAPSEERSLTIVESRAITPLEPTPSQIAPALQEPLIPPPQASSQEVQVSQPLSQPASPVNTPAYDEESLVKILSTLALQLNELRERVTRIEQHALVGIDTNIEQVMGELAAIQQARQ